MKLQELERMANMSFSDVDIDDIAMFDAKNIDESKSVEDRLLEFIEDVGNPYFRKTIIADVRVIVKIGFSNDGSKFGNNVLDVIHKNMACGM